MMRTFGRSTRRMEETRDRPLAQGSKVRRKILDLAEEWKGKRIHCLQQAITSNAPESNGFGLVLRGDGAGYASDLNTGAFSGSSPVATVD